TFAAASTTTAQAGAFVCANPAGSNLTYAYVRGDGGLYTVTGCIVSQRLPLSANSFPIAWSPSNRYLAVSATTADFSYPLVIYEPSSGKTIPTKFLAQYPSDASIGKTLRKFLGWVDDNTFLGALQPVISVDPAHPLGTSTIVKVDVVTQDET